MERYHGILMLSELGLSIRVPNDCTKFRQNRLIIATVERPHADRLDRSMLQQRRRKIRCMHDTALHAASGFNK